MRQLTGLVASGLLLTALIGCEDSSTVGSSLTGDNVRIVIDSGFTVTGECLRMQPIAPKTTEQLLGVIKADGYGTFGSEIVTQFLPSTELDTAGWNSANIDSVFLTLRYINGLFLGDSVAPLGVTVYELNQPLKLDELNSAFNPSGFYYEDPLASMIYNVPMSPIRTSSSLAYRDLDVKLPVEFGRRLFDAYIANPANFANGQVFVENVFPGFYLQNSYGSGRLTAFSQTLINLYMSKVETKSDGTPDTISAQNPLCYFMATPEVISNNSIIVELDDNLQQEVAGGKDMIIAPAGYEMEIRFPAPEIIASYTKESNSLSVVNSLSMTLPADSIANPSKISPPKYILMVLKKDREDFFSQNKVPDNTTSFYAEYDKTLGGYYFGKLTTYINELITKEEEVTEEDYTFSVLPVQVSFQTLATNSQSQVVSDVQPYFVSPAMAEVHIDKAKVKFTFSQQIQSK